MANDQLQIDLAVSELASVQGGQVLPARTDILRPSGDYLVGLDIALVVLDYPERSALRADVAPVLSCQ